MFGSRSRMETIPRRRPTARIRASRVGSCSRFRMARRFISPATRTCSATRPDQEDLRAGRGGAAIGDHSTMGPRESCVAAELVGAPRVVPSHYGTFPLLTGTPATLRPLLPGGSSCSSQLRAKRSALAPSRGSSRVPTGRRSGARVGPAGRRGAQRSVRGRAATHAAGRRSRQQGVRRRHFEQVTWPRVAGTNEETRNPLLHGEVSCLNRYWELTGRATGQRRRLPLRVDP